MIGSLLGTTGRYVPSATNLADTAKFEQLEARLNGLELTCSALWELLKKKNGYTDEELVALIHEVDGRDGVVDGKIGPQQSVCPQCGRKLLARASHRCLWCGAELAAAPFTG